MASLRQTVTSEEVPARKQRPLMHTTVLVIARGSGRHLCIAPVAAADRPVISL